MKAILLSALLGLGFSATNLRGALQDNDKVAQFLEQHHEAIEEIVGTAIKVGDFLNENDIASIGDYLDDLEDNQLFHFKKDLKKAGHFISKHHKAIEEGIKIVGQVATSDELFSLKKEANKVGHFVSKNKGAIEGGVKTVTDIANGNYEGAVDSGLDTITAATHQNELFNLKKEADKVGHFVKKNKGAIEGGVKTVTDIANGNYEGAVDSGLDTITAATHQNELFNLKKEANKVGHFVKKNKGAIEGGVKTVTDIANGNYEGAVDSGLDTITAATHQNELFSLKKAAKKVGHFVSKNHKAIEEGVQVAGTLGVL